MRFDDVRPAGGLVAVHAHPDDETLSTGALLATWAATGDDVAVVTCTRGERGEVIALPGTTSEGLAHLEGDGPGLAAHREGEVRAAVAALGRVDHVFLDTVALPGEPDDDGARPRYEDSGMAWLAPGIARATDAAPERAFVGVPLDEAARRLATVLRARRPAVVATYEAGGGYGHPDHVRTHAVTARALVLAADETADVAGAPWHVPSLWLVVAPADDVRAARRALADLARTAPGTTGALADGLALPDPDEALPPVARDDVDPSDVVAVPLGPVLDRVLGALRAHATQVQAAAPAPAGAGVAGWYALSNDVLAPLPLHETYLPVRPARSQRLPSTPR